MASGTIFIMRTGITPVDMLLIPFLLPDTKTVCAQDEPEIDTGDQCGGATATYQG